MSPAASVKPGFGTWFLWLPQKLKFKIDQNEEVSFVTSVILTQSLQLLPSRKLVGLKLYDFFLYCYKIEQKNLNFMLINFEFMFFCSLSFLIGVLTEQALKGLQSVTVGLMLFHAAQVCGVFS